MTDSPTHLPARRDAALTPAEAGDMPDLVRYAIGNQVPVEVLERIVALQERIMERDARAAFFEAMTRFRAECPQPKKTRQNIQFTVTRNGVKRPSMYSPLEEIDRVARPVAAKHGLTWTWDTLVDGDLIHYDCRLMHVMGHTQVSRVSLPHESKSGASPQQKFGSTQQYGMRYSLLAALGLTTADEDLDGAQAESCETITEEQLADLEALIEEVKADRARFLKFLGVENLSSLPVARLQGAIQALEAKRKGAS